MPEFQIDWKVTEVVNGPGQHDDGVRDRDRRQLASGSVVKEAESADVLRSELTEALERAFPKHALGPTYDLDRLYDISIVEVARGEPAG